MPAQGHLTGQFERHGLTPLRPAQPSDPLGFGSSRWKTDHADVANKT